MKKLVKGMLVAVIAVLLVVGMVSCGGGSPSAVARAFFDAAQKGDLKAVQKVTTPETGALLGMFWDMAKEQMKKSDEDAKKITKTSEKIDGDTAVVTLTFANGETDDVDLKKVDGKWLVNISK